MLFRTIFLRHGKYHPFCMTAANIPLLSTAYKVVNIFDRSDVGDISLWLMVDIVITQK
jgi:hypothetical protein